MLTVEVAGADAVAAQLAALPASVRQALRRRAAALSAELVARVKQKLSGEVLAARSGRLRDSVHQEAGEGGSGIFTRIAVGVPYAAIHEFGGTIPAHTIAARKGEALHWVAGGKDFFAPRVAHPGATIPERSYLRAALAEMEDEIVSGLRAAVAEGIAAVRD